LTIVSTSKFSMHVIIWEKRESETRYKGFSYFEELTVATTVGYLLFAPISTWISLFFSKSLI